MHMGVTVSVISGKGGTGKTTLCAGIAACLAAEGKRVLCIDADIGLLNTNVGDIRVDLWDMRNIADELRTIQVNSYLELQEINLNTANAVKELKMANVVLSGIKAGTDRI